MIKLAIYGKGGIGKSTSAATRRQIPRETCWQESR